MFNPFRSSPNPALLDAIARAANGSLTLIDVREPAETASGHAQNALLIPLALLPLKLHPSSPDKPSSLTLNTPLALYCAAGGRSAQACATLTQMGYTNVTNIGGFNDWRTAGGPCQ